jgi:cytochrome c-type biogenesis protein CcmH
MSVNPIENLDLLREQLVRLQSLHDAGVLDAAQFQAAREPLEKRIVQAVMAGAGASAPSHDSAALAGYVGVAGATSPASATSEIGLAPAAPARARANDHVRATGVAPIPHETVVQAPLSLWLKAFAFAAVVAGAGYAWKGSPQGAGSAPPGFDSSGAAAAPEGGASAPHRVGREQIEAMAAKLAARLKETPDDAEGWSMLGRTHMAISQPKEALAAYATSIKLRPDDAPTLADMADALAASQGRNIDGEPAKLIARALKIDPDNLKALALAGSLAFNNGDDATAVKHWDRAVRVGPADSPLVEMSRGAAQEARERSKLPPAATATAAAPATASLLDIAKGTGGAGGAGTSATASAAAAAGAGKAAAPPTGSTGSGSSEASAATATATAITGTVKLAAALQGKAGAEDTVFIFARNAEGGGMPLAVLRKQVKDLPLAFTLDDSLAMSPAARISGAKKVLVVARVSKSGQATAAPGDLEGVSAPLAPGARDLQLEIGTIRP